MLGGNVTDKLGGILLVEIGHADVSYTVGALLKLELAPMPFQSPGENSKPQRACQKCRKCRSTASSVTMPSSARMLRAAPRTPLGKCSAWCFGCTLLTMKVLLTRPARCKAPPRVYCGYPSLASAVSAIAMPDDKASIIDGFIPPSSSPTVPKPTIGGISCPTERRK